MADFEMTEADLAELMEAFKPVPLIAINCGMPHANAAWARLGAKMGFEPMSVRPNGKGDRFFSATPLAQIGAKP